MDNGIYTVAGGMVTFSESGMEILDRLDQCFLSWGQDISAAHMKFPPFVPVSDLNSIDYFNNFPHLAIVATEIDRNSIELMHSEKDGVRDVIPADKLASAAAVIPSASCYQVYLNQRGRVLSQPFRVAVRTQCARHESHFDSLRRLRAFQMREFVSVGSQEATREHCAWAKSKLDGLGLALGLNLRFEPASDPFWKDDDGRARMQRLFPSKEEVMVGDLAIASINFHRNFFGERCNIRLNEGEFAFSSCVGMGLERWLHVLLQRFDGSADRIKEALGDYLESDTHQRRRNLA